MNLPLYKSAGIKNALNIRSQIKDYAKLLANYDNAAVLASGMFYPLAKEAALKMKSILEPIKELVPGAVDIQVLYNEIPSSNREVALISTFEDISALETYQTHPAHVEAGKYVRSVTCDRACMDYTV